MTIAFGAQAVNSDQATSATTHTVSLTLTAGDLCVLLIGCRDGAQVSSVAGSVSTTGWARIDNPSINATPTPDLVAEIWWKDNCDGGSETITVTHGSAVRAGINMSRWTRDAAISVEDFAAAQTNASTSHSMGEVSSAGAALMIAAVNGDGGTWTKHADWTDLTVPLAGRYEPQYRIVTGATTQDGVQTTAVAQYSAAFTAVFKEGASVTKKLKLLAHSSAIGATGCTVEVFAEPSAGDLTGTKFGKSTGEEWVAGTGGDAGYAVMKIPVADFSGSALAVNDTPVAIVENTTHAAVRLADPYSIVIEE